MEKTSVSFDAHQKRWCAVNLDGFSYNHKDHRRVLLHALRHDHPDIYHTVHRMTIACSQDGNGNGIPLPVLDRLLKAAQLLTKGHVFQSCVLSQDGNERVYQVKREGIPLAWSCTCTDFQNGGVSCDYGQQCKHTFAQLIASLMNMQLAAFPPQPDSFVAQGEFLQDMDEHQARRMHDPNYAHALEKGGSAIFWYLYHEILSDYTAPLYRNVHTVMQIPASSDHPPYSPQQIAQTELAIRGHFCRGKRFFKIFELPELNGESYAPFWEHFWNFCHNGQLSRLKGELIQAISERL